MMIAESVAAQTARGHRSVLFSHSVRVLCKLVSVPVLARFVSPAEHGLFAMAASLTLLLTLFRDLGLGTAAVQTPRLDEDERTTLCWAHVLIGCVLAAATLALIPPLIRFYEQPRLGPLTALMSVSFIGLGINAWPRVLLARDLHFETLNRLETTAIMVATAAMIATGIAGGGAYSFAVFLLVSEGCTMISAWRACSWRPRGRCDWQRLRPLLRTGTALTFHQLITHLSSVLPAIAIGRWFGATPLGFYNRSAQLLILPVQHVATPCAHVLLSSLSRTDRNAMDFPRELRNTTRLILYVTLPLLAFCLALPIEITRLLLGVSWLDAAPFLRWLAVGTAVTAVSSTLYPLAVALRQTRRMAALAVITLVINLAAIAAGRDGGALGIVQTVALANTALLFPRLWWITRGSPAQVADYLSAATGPSAAATTLFIGLYAGAHLTGAASATSRVMSGTVVAVLCLALLCLAWPRLRSELRQVWSHRPRLAHPSAPTAHDAS